MSELVRWIVDRLPRPTAANWRETAIVSPSAFAADALRESIARAGHDLLGVHFVTVPGLARLILLRCGVAAPRRRPDPLEERALLRQALARADGPLGDYARRFPAAQRHLAAAIREWQLARRPTPDGGGIAREFLAIAADYERATASFATRARLLDLALAALDEAGPVPAPAFDVLSIAVPEHADAAALRTALTRAGCRVYTWPGSARFALGRGATAASQPTAIDSCPIDPVVVTADTSADSDAANDQTTGGSRNTKVVSLTSAPDPSGELRHAARGAVDLAARGVPWHRIVVAVPNLRAYARCATRAFAAEGAPLCTAAESSLLGEPRAALHLHAARVLFGDAARSSYLALLTTDLARDPLPPAELGCFDRLSRDQHFEGRGPHVAAFLRLLQDTGAPHVAERLVDWIRHADDVADRADTVAARCALLRDWLDAMLRPPLASNARDLVCTQRLDDAYAALERAAHAYAADSDGAGYVRELEELLLERGMPLYGAARHRDAVRLVDYDDALALPAHSIWICGLADEMVPRPGHSFATTIGERECVATGLPDPASTRAVELANLQRLCAHADEAVFLVRPRRDFEGRPVAPSIWLAELAPIELRRTEWRLPTHPLARTEIEAAQGRAAHDSALTRLVLLGADENAIAAVAGPRGASTWRIAHELERFEPTSLARDGDFGAAVGRQIAAGSLSISALRTFGHCPLQYAFAHVLGLDRCKLPPEPDPFELPKDRLGSRIHAVLERLYADFAERLGAASHCEPFAAAMAEHATWLLETELGPDSGPLQRDFPTLHLLHERRWREALLTFVRFDLARLDADGSRPDRIEHSLGAKLSLPRPSEAGIGASGLGDTPPATIELSVHGRADRLDRLADGGVRLIDFKTGAAPKEENSPTEILKLRRPQLAGYTLALSKLGDSVHAAEICAIHPRGAADLAEETRHSYEFERVIELPHGEFGQRFATALGIAAALRERAALLPTPDPNACRHCGYRLACRRLHPPSRERVRQAEIAEFVRFGRLAELARTARTGGATRPASD